MVIQRTSLINILSCSDIELISLKKGSWSWKEASAIFSPSFRNYNTADKDSVIKVHQGGFNYCKLQFIFKSQNKPCNNCHFKESAPQIVTSAVVYKYHCGLCTESYFGECMRRLVIKSGKHIGISLN